MLEQPTNQLLPCDTGFGSEDRDTGEGGESRTFMFHAENLAPVSGP